MALLGTMVLIPSPCRRGVPNSERRRGCQQVQLHVRTPLPQDNHRAEHQADGKQMHLHFMAPSAGRDGTPGAMPKVAHGGVTLTLARHRPHAVACSTDLKAAPNAHHVKCGAQPPAGRREHA